MGMCHGSNNVLGVTMCPLFQRPDNVPVYCVEVQTVGDLTFLVPEDDYNHLPTYEHAYREYCLTTPFMLPRMLKFSATPTIDFINRYKIMNSGSKGLNVEIEWVGDPNSIMETLEEHLSNTLSKHKERGFVYTIGNYVNIYLPKLTEVTFMNVVGLLSRMRISEDISAYQLGVNGDGIRQLATLSNARIGLLYRIPLRFIR